MYTILPCKWHEQATREYTRTARAWIVDHDWFVRVREGAESEEDAYNLQVRADELINWRPSERFQAFKAEYLEADFSDPLNPPKFCFRPNKKKRIRGLLQQIYYPIR